MQSKSPAKSITVPLQSHPSSPGDTWLIACAPASDPINAALIVLGGDEQDTPQQEASSAEPIDATGIFVDIAFRSTPWAQEAAEQGSSDTTARILFVSESNVCRSVLAEAIMRRLLQERGLAQEVSCESKGTRCAPTRLSTINGFHVLALLCGHAAASSTSRQACTGNGVHACMQWRQQAAWGSLGNSEVHTWKGVPHKG